MIEELSAMEQHYQAVLEVLVGGSQVTEVAERFGVSRQSVHDWVRLYKDGGIAALADQSQRPHHHPDRPGPRWRSSSASCAARITAGVPAGSAMSWAAKGSSGCRPARRSTGCSSATT